MEGENRLSTSELVVGLKGVKSEFNASKQVSESVRQSHLEMAIRCNHGLCEKKRSEILPIE